MDVSKIKDEDSLRAWLEGRSRDDAIAISFRSAARVVPLFLQEEGDKWPFEEDMTPLLLSRALAPLLVLRALITAGVAQTKPSAEIKAAALTAVVAESSTSAGAHAAAATRAAAYASGFNTAGIQAIYAAAARAASHATDAAAAARVGIASATEAVAFTAAVWTHLRNEADILEGNGNLFVEPLWNGEPPKCFSSTDSQVRKIWAKNPETWDFWVRWWDGVVTGKPLDWELQKQVALIPDDDWQKGPDHIASLIRQIEAGFTKVQDTAPKAPKPDTTLYLTQNRLVARMQAQGLAGQIADVIERYARDTGCNDLPDEFQALKSMPAVLLGLGRMLADATTTEDALRAEVQRLNAQVLRLEADLREAKAKTLTGTLSKSFVEQAGKSLGDWKMWGALIGGVSYLGGVPAMVDAAQSIADSVRGIFGDQLPEPPSVGVPASPDIPPLMDV